MGSEILSTAASRAARTIEIDDGKTNLLRELLEDIGPDVPVVIFCRFHHDLDTIKRIAEELDRGGRDKTCGEISGRMNEYREWRDGQFSTLAVQTQAGGLGIDLTRARYAIFYTLTYSLGDYQQAVARIHRPGQNHPVTIYHLTAAGTVDKRILRALEKRQDVIQAVLKGFKEEGHERSDGRVAGHVAEQRA